MSCTLPLPCAKSRQGYISTATLSQLLLQLNHADLLWRLTELLDYLALPGPMMEWMPPPSAVPLRHVGVLELRREASTMAVVAARDAVNVMLGSVAYATDFGCGDVNKECRTAAFYITEPDQPVGKAPLFRRLHVFALPLPHNFPATQPSFMYGSRRWGGYYPGSTTAVLVSDQVHKPSAQLCNIIKESGQGIGKDSQPVLHDALCAELSAAIRSIPMNGRAAKLHGESAQVQFGQGYHNDRCNIPVWYVWW